MSVNAKRSEILRTAACAVLLLLGGAAGARAEVALGGKAGTLGGGVELTVGLSPQWNVRLGVNAYNYTDDGREASGIDYDAKAQAAHGRRLLLDFHPGGRGFRLSGGADLQRHADRRPQPAARLGRLRHRRRAGAGRAWWAPWTAGSTSTRSSPTSGSAGATPCRTRPERALRRSTSA